MSILPRLEASSTPHPLRAALHSRIRASLPQFGQARWRLENSSGDTRLLFEARIRPAFWVPPLIGPWVIGRVLREEARSTCDGLERLARMRLP